MVSQTGRCAFHILGFLAGHRNRMIPGEEIASATEVPSWIGLQLPPRHRVLPEDLKYPLIIKPNAEGSPKGITQDSVVESREACETRLENLLSRYPAGLVVEEFIAGRELSIPILEALPGKIVDIVEHTFDLDDIGGAEKLSWPSLTAQGQTRGDVESHRPGARHPRGTV